MSDITTSANVSPTASADAAIVQQQQTAVRALNSNDVQGAAQNKKFDKIMQDYEGVFLSQMVSHMYDTVPVDPQFGGGAGEQTMRSLLVNEYGKQMAAAGGIGLAAQMKKQLLAAQAEMVAKQSTAQAVDPAAGAAPVNNGEQQ